MTYRAEIERDEQGQAKRLYFHPEPPEAHVGTADATGSVRTLWRACLACGREFQINPRHADEHRCCSAACRSRLRHERLARQSRLAFDPPAEPLVPLATPKQIKDAHKAQTRLVLSMLQAGEQTTQTFLAAYVGRFGARIGELRAVGWPITTQKLGEHSALYVLVGPRDASRGACAEPGCAVCAVEGA